VRGGLIGVVGEGQILGLDDIDARPDTAATAFELAATSAGARLPPGNVRRSTPNSTALLLTPIIISPLSIQRSSDAPPTGAVR